MLGIVGAGQGKKGSLSAPGDVAHEVGKGAAGDGEVGERHRVLRLEAPADDVERHEHAAAADAATYMRDGGCGCVGVRAAGPVKADRRTHARRHWHGRRADRPAPSCRSAAPNLTTNGRGTPSVGKAIRQGRSAPAAMKMVTTAMA